MSPSIMTRKIGPVQQWVPSNTIATRDNFEALLDAGRLSIKVGPARWWTLSRLGPTEDGVTPVWVPQHAWEYSIESVDFDAIGVLDRNRFRVFEPYTKV